MKHIYIAPDASAIFTLDLGKIIPRPYIIGNGVYYTSNGFGDKYQTEELKEDLLKKYYEVLGLELEYDLSTDGCVVDVRIPADHAKHPFDIDDNFSNTFIHETCSSGLEDFPNHEVVKLFGVLDRATLPRQYNYELTSTKRIVLNKTHDDYLEKFKEALTEIINETEEVKIFLSKKYFRKLVREAELMRNKEPVSVLSFLGDNPHEKTWEVLEPIIFNSIDKIEIGLTDPNLGDDILKVLSEYSYNLGDTCTLYAIDRSAKDMFKFKTERPGMLGFAKIYNLPVSDESFTLMSTNKELGRPNADLGMAIVKKKTLSTVFELDRVKKIIPELNLTNEFLSVNVQPIFQSRIASEIEAFGKIAFKPDGFTYKVGEASIIEKLDPPMMTTTGIMVYNDMIDIYKLYKDNKISGEDVTSYIYDTDQPHMPLLGSIPLGTKNIPIAIRVDGKVKRLRLRVNNQILGRNELNRIKGPKKVTVLRGVHALPTWLLLIETDDTDCLIFNPYVNIIV